VALLAISLPRTAVVPVAIIAARRAKVIAIVAAVLCAACLLIGVADVIDDSRKAARDDAAALFWVALFGFACGFAVWRARRITAAARRAAADVGSTWTLTGNLIVAADDHGQPVMEHSFKITRGQRALLVADLPAS
jgi:peptidoglycan/LPS O-acetylase OafA/YrhL